MTTALRNYTHEVQVDLSDCNEILIKQNVSEKNTFISVFEAGPQMLLMLGARHGHT
jgi:hypothetical protein